LHLQHSREELEVTRGVMKRKSSSTAAYPMNFMFEQPDDFVGNLSS